MLPRHIGSTSVAGPQLLTSCNHAPSCVASVSIMTARARARRHQHQPSPRGCTRPPVGERVSACTSDAWWNPSGPFAPLGRSSAISTTSPGRNANGASLRAIARTPHVARADCREDRQPAGWKTAWTQEYRDLNSTKRRELITLLGGYGGRAPGLPTAFRCADEASSEMTAVVCQHYEQ